MLRNRRPTLLYVGHSGVQMNLRFSNELAIGRRCRESLQKSFIDDTINLSVMNETEIVRKVNRRTKIKINRKIRERGCDSAFRQSDGISAQTASRVGNYALCMPGSAPGYSRRRQLAVGQTCIGDEEQFYHRRCTE